MDCDVTVLNPTSLLQPNFRMFDRLTQTVLLKFSSLFPWSRNYFSSKWHLPLLLAHQPHPTPWVFSMFLSTSWVLTCRKKNNLFLSCVTKSPISQSVIYLTWSVRLAWSCLQVRHKIKIKIEEKSFLEVYKNKVSCSRTITHYSIS